MWKQVISLGVGSAIGYSLCQNFPKEQDVQEKAPKIEPPSSAPLYRIALTGGPCGGKSSSLKHLTKSLNERGYQVYSVPEIPSMMIIGGAKYPGLNAKERLVEFESAIVHLQMQAEQSFQRCAKAEKQPAVVIMDRGMLDIPAYLPREMWLTILKANGLEESELMSRYDLVLHLVTAADGAEKFYITSNNAARSETPEQARVLDAKVKECWAKHPNQFIIKNGGTFKEKLQEATDRVVKYIEANEKK